MGHCSPADVVPALHALAGQMTAVASADASCGPGCGACCRQLVPVAPAEIGHLQRVVAGLPSQRRREVEDVARQANSELRRVCPVPVNGLPRLESADRVQLGRDWFGLGLPCPFLIDESCSIHHQRPLACREYLVSSPPEACGAPGAGRIRRLALPISVWSRVARDEEGQPTWLPLTEALWADPPGKPSGPGSEVIAALLGGRVGGEG